MRTVSPKFSKKKLYEQSIVNFGSESKLEPFSTNQIPVKFDSRPTSAAKEPLTTKVLPNKLLRKP